MTVKPDSSFDRALEALGIDPTLTREQLARSPAERIAESCERTRFHQRLQRRTLTPAALAALTEREIDEDLARLGPEEQRSS
jgi:hypothetical protein